MAEDNRDNLNNILSFSQDAGFYVRAGKRQAESGNLPEALTKLRKAYEMAPSDRDTVIAFAEVLNRMQRYEESLAVLLSFGAPTALPQEGLFGLISNYLGLEEFIEARRFMLMYLDKFPDGAYAGTCSDYLDMMSDSEEMNWQLGLGDGEDMELIAHIHLSKAMHISGLNEESVTYLTALTEKYPDSLWLQMEIALGEFSLGDNLACEHRIINILKKDRSYIRARCLLAYLRLNEKKTEEARQILDSIPIPTEADFDGLGALSAVLLETGMYEKAEECCERFLSYLPYDPLIMHQTAFAKYMLGKTDEAAALYRDALVLNSHDTVAKYYLGWMETHPDPAKGGKGFMVTYDVSYGEALRRFRKIGSLLEKRLSGNADGEEEGDELTDLISWGIRSPLFRSKKPLFYALTALGGDTSVRILKEYLLSLDQPDDDKQRAFSALHMLGAAEPFNIYYHGMWQYEVTAQTEELPSSYRKIAEQIASLGESHALPDTVVAGALHFFECYVRSFNGNFPRLDRFRRDATAGAFTVLAMQAQKTEPDWDLIKKLFSVTRRRVENAVGRVLEQMGNREEEKKEENTEE